MSFYCSHQSKSGFFLIWYLKTLKTYWITYHHILRCRKTFVCNTKDLICFGNNPSTFCQGESPLHTACRFGLASLTAELLQQGANPNLQTQKALPEDTAGVAMQSPLHMAIANNHPDVVSVILEQKGQPLYIKACK